MKKPVPALPNFFRSASGNHCQRTRPDRNWRQPYRSSAWTRSGGGHQSDIICWFRPMGPRLCGCTPKGMFQLKFNWVNTSPIRLRREHAGNSARYCRRFVRRGLRWADLTPIPPPMYWVVRAYPPRRLRGGGGQHLFQPVWRRSDAITIAQIGQEAENRFFGNPAACWIRLPLLLAA